ncbi:MAG: thiamine phosphate synthase [Deltaproteobacteria bacterium]|jgi:thiamine-phosphate pyrophosphorylase|nr:thiamine phosphate synthase [Deltaproteobacteria bacterium]
MPACDFRLALITDRHLSPRPLAEVTDKILAAGVGWVLLREKDLTEAELMKLAGTLKSLTERYGARLIVNSSLPAALATQAYGLHLPFASLEREPEVVKLAKDKGLRVGVSIHSLEEGRLALKAEADTLLFGPIAPTKSKPGHPGHGLAVLRELTKRLAQPLWAVGGLKPDMTREILWAGATTICLRSSLMTAEDPGSLVARFKMALPPESPN